MTKSSGKLKMNNVGYAPLDRGQVNVDPIAASADAIREALRSMPVSQSLVVGALPGQTVVIRYPRLRDVQDDQIDQAVEAEASQNIPYDLSEVFLDWSLLEEEEEGDSHQIKVLLVAAKHEIIEARLQLAAAAEIEYGVLSVDSLSLADAAEGCDFLRVGESVALIHIGASSVSIHFTKDGVSNFIRDISWGAKEMIQAIAKARRCDYDQAERILANIEEELGASKPDALPKPPAAPSGGDAPPMPPLPEDPAAQVDLSEDPLAQEITAGAEGASLLDPLEGELDVLGIEAPAPSGDRPPAMGGGMGDGMPEKETISDILALPISRLVAEIRRSFDYYEHQLYERPVERVILSGGVAHLGLFREALVDDLGIDEVELADPSNGAISTRGIRSNQFSEHPAQFMVAVGLAARGAAEI